MKVDINNMAVVYKKKDEDLETLIKRFKKKVLAEGILVELRRREYYLSPAQKQREKSKQAQKKLRKYNSKQNLIEFNPYDY